MILYDERIDFLDLQPGSSALVIGGFGGLLAEKLSDTYQNVLLLDWDNERLKQTASLFDSITPETRHFKCGDLNFDEAGFDTILILFVFPFLGTPDLWMNKLRNSLAPEGKLLLIDSISRPSSTNQELSTEILQLRLFLAAAEGFDLNPNSDPEENLRLMRTSYIKHPRLRTFTDQDLLFDNSYWKEEGNRTIDYAHAAIKQCDKELCADIQKRVDKLKEGLRKNHPATPPFVLLSGVNLLDKTNDQSHSPKKESQFKKLDSASGKKIPLRELPVLQRKMLKESADSLKNEELLSLVLSSPSTEIDESLNLSALCGKIGQIYGDNAICAERDVGRLAESLGVSVQTSCRIIAIFELGRRCFSEPPSGLPVIKTPEDAHKYLQDMGDLKKEHLRGLYLDVRSRLIHVEVLSIGTLSKSIIHPREVYAPALEHAANAVILAHNHPTGDPSPSEADKTVTRIIANAGNIMGIELLDHIIIGGGEIVSMKKAGVF